MQQAMAEGRSVLMSVSSLHHHPLPFHEGRGHRKGEGRDGTSRATSVLSFLGIERQDMIELFDNEHTSGVCLLVKMLSVVGVPVITVILLSLLLLYNAVDTHRLSNVAIDELQAFYQVDQLVTNLQVCTIHAALNLSLIHI